MSGLEYTNSLLVAFVALFVISIAIRARRIGGLQLRPEGARPRRISVWTYTKSSQFWFESFENWQSEFLAVFALVTLSIWLRQAVLRNQSRSLLRSPRPDQAS